MTKAREEAEMGMKGWVGLLVFLLSVNVSNPAHIRGGDTQLKGKQPKGKQSIGKQLEDPTACSLERVITPPKGKVGSIQSSKQGLPYANNARCSWQIRGGDASASSITLTFIQFNLEKRGTHTGKCYGT